MTPNLTRLLNKTVFVSIPALFDDKTCRPYKLLGIELTGLWLQSEELTDRLVADDSAFLKDLAPMVFVPFSHIAGVLAPTGMPAAPATPKTVNSDANIGTAGQAGPKHEK